MEFKNGCTQAPGCAGSPTHVYRPQGGFPVGYCAACVPGFLKKDFSRLPKADAYEQVVERVMTAVEAPTTAEPTPEDATPAEPEPTDEPAAPAPKRRTRRKKTTPEFERNSPEEPTEE